MLVDKKKMAKLTAYKLAVLVLALSSFKQADCAGSPITNIVLIFADDVSCYIGSIQNISCLES